MLSAIIHVTKTHIVQCDFLKVEGKITCRSVSGWLPEMIIVTAVFIYLYANISLFGLNFFYFIPPKKYIQYAELQAQRRCLQQNTLRLLRFYGIHHFHITKTYRRIGKLPENRKLNIVFNILHHNLGVQSFVKFVDNNTFYGIFIKKPHKNPCSAQHG
ncbi:MAG: hypothetical protein BWY70_01996 [Bacteroidetes bacterium ADurb.Bin408]|nr:MAG: hypothetical protein BWY70_01996 [Bacteroidetes bacterium ADurb.Bin408]